MSSTSRADNPYETNLDKVAANYVPLTPLSFLARAAAVYPEKTAVIDGRRRFSYREFATRVTRLASALAKRGVGAGDTVAVFATNIPALLEAHYGVPLLGAVLNAINTRLDHRTVAFILEHGGAKVVLSDRELSPVMKQAITAMAEPPLVVDVDDAALEEGELIGALEYEDFLAEGDADFPWPALDDEWRAIALNYTSGTTGNPKGVVYHHRGAYLNALGQVLALGLSRHTIYLWTLPMFHCNGWCFTWGVSAVAGTHVCLRKVDPAAIFPAIVEHGVTHMCGAPVVLNSLIHAPAEHKRSFPHTVEVATGGAAPPSSVIAAMEDMGFHVTHLYGLTETYGPATLCAWQSHWDSLARKAQALQAARQGVRYPTLEAVRVADAKSRVPVPADGQTIGEVMMRGNTVMKGYLKNPQATEEAFHGGWFHSGDLGVMHEDGYLEIKDRLKDIIISGGENISSLEVEEVLYRHPKVMEAAVVARADEKWGETPCAFVTLTDDGDGVTAEEIIAYCRDNMAHYKAPKTVIFGPLPKTSTGKIQKYVLREQVKSL